jgi:putative transposase
MTYPSNLTDKQWELIKPHFDTGKYGKSRKHSQRSLIDAVFYIIKTGCQW